MGGINLSLGFESSLVLSFDPSLATTGSHPPQLRSSDNLPMPLPRESRSQKPGAEENYLTMWNLNEIAFGFKGFTLSTLSRSPQSSDSMLKEDFGNQTLVVWKLQSTSSICGYVRSSLSYGPSTMQQQLELPTCCRYVVNPPARFIE